MLMGEGKGEKVYDFTGKENEAPDFENVMCSSFVLLESSRRRVILVPTRSHAKTITSVSSFFQNSKVYGR